MMALATNPEQSSTQRSPPSHVPHAHVAGSQQTSSPVSTLSGRSQLMMTGTVSFQKMMEVFPPKEYDRNILNPISWWIWNPFNFFWWIICRAFLFETSWGVSTNPSEKKNMIVNLDHFHKNRVVYIKKHLSIHHRSEKHAKTMAVFQAHLIISILGIGSPTTSVSRATSGCRVTPPFLQTIFNGYFISKHPNKQTNQEYQEYTRAICTIWNPSTKNHESFSLSPLFKRICTAPTIRCFPTSPNHSQLIKKIPLHPNYQQIYPYLKHGWGWKRTSFLLGKPAYFEEPLLLVLRRVISTENWNLTSPSLLLQHLKLQCPLRCFQTWWDALENRHAHPIFPTKQPLLATLQNTNDLQTNCISSNLSLSYIIEVCSIKLFLSPNYVILVDQFTTITSGLTLTLLKHLQLFCNGRIARLQC